MPSLWVLLCSLAVLVAANEGKSLPEVKLTTSQLIKYWGYPAETHEAVTKDGYVLTLFRYEYILIVMIIPKDFQHLLFILSEFLN